MMEKTTTAGTATSQGARLNTVLSALAGSRGSFVNSLMPSATVWSRPIGPARLGPIRFCMKLMTLRSNQIMLATAVRYTTKPMRHLRATMSRTAPSTPSSNSGSPAASSEGTNALMLIRPPGR